MSEGWAALPNTIVRDPNLPTLSKIVLLVITSHVGRSGYRLSHARLAAEAGCSVRTVQRAIQDLQERGLLRVESVSGLDGQPNNYRLGFDLFVRSATESDPVGQTDLGGRPEVPTEEEPVKKNQSRARATAAPDTLPITDSMREWWAERSHPAVDLFSETEKFLNHHRAKGSTFKDWTAAWRNWMGNAVTYAQRDGRARRPARQREVYPK